MDDNALLRQLINERAQIATVCTEPATIAFAAASAAKLLGEVPDSIAVSVCPGVFKNALGAGLPGTERRGPAMAAALGALIATPEAGLTILRSVQAALVHSAAALVDDGRATAAVDPTHEGLFVHAIARSRGHVASATVAGSHSQIARATLDGQPAEPPQADAGAPAEAAAPADVLPKDGANDLAVLREWPFRRLVTAALALGPDEIACLHEGAVENLRLGETSLRSGSRAGTSAPPVAGPYFPGLVDAAEVADTAALDRRVRSLVAAAVGARMAGRDWPVLTSAGSGNQGLTIAIATLLAAGALGADERRQAQALALAHAVNLYIHAFIGEVSPACGATTAACGVAVAACWLLGGDCAQMESAAQMTLAGLFGMLCDGAKGSCALKCGVAAVEGLLCGQWARSGRTVRPDTGITGRSLPETLALAQSIVELALRQADELIIARRTGSPAGPPG